MIKENDMIVTDFMAGGYLKVERVENDIIIVKINGTELEVERNQIIKIIEEE